MELKEKVGAWLVHVKAVDTKSIIPSSRTGRVELEEEKSEFFTSGLVSFFILTCRSNTEASAVSRCFLLCFSDVIFSTIGERPLVEYITERRRLCCVTSIDVRQDKLFRGKLSALGRQQVLSLKSLILRSLLRVELN